MNPIQNQSKFLAAAALVLLLPIAVQAQDYLFTTNNGTITITKYIGAGGDVTIPCTLSGLAVTSIAGGNGYGSDGAFYDRGNVTSVTIPVCVTNIGGGSYSYNGAFSGCTILTNAMIGNGVITIGDNAFYGCSALKSVTIGSSVKTIGDNSNGSAFYGCTALKSVTIPNSVISIGLQAFCNCTSLTNAIIGNNVTNIGVAAFANCTALKSVTIGNSVATIAGGNGYGSDGAFYGCTSLTSVTIPDSVTNIGGGSYSYDGAFSGCSSLTNAIIGNGVITIGDNAFYECTALKSVTIGTSVTTIGDNSNGSAFYGCTALKTVTIPDSVISIGLQAFYNCTGLTNAIIGNGVTSIGVAAFAGCTLLKNVTIGNSVTSIAGGNGYGSDGAFYYCTSLTSVTIPDSVTNIGGGSYSYDGAFSGCSSLTNAIIGNGVITIGDNAFYECTALKSVTIGTSVTTIGDNSNGSAFYGCSSLTSVTIPDSVISIGLQAFYNCTGLTNAIIGNGVTSIGVAAFAGCTLLKNVTIGNSVTSIAGGNGYGSYGAFYGCSSLTSVTIPDSVTSIGGGSYSYDGAFSGCSSLTNAIIGNGVITIGDNAFYECTALKSVTIGTSVTTIGDNSNGSAFYGCSSLTSVTIPDSVISIGLQAFYNCTGLTNAIIGNGVTSIGVAAFAGCTLLKNVTIGNSVTSIAGGNGYGSYGAFYGCSSLTSVTIPDSVTSIGGGSYSYDGAFSGCSSLTSVTIGNSVTSIGNNAFQNCGSLKGVYFRGSPPISFGSNVFSGDTYVIVYYLPSATGWAGLTSLGGRPVALWPVALVVAPSGTIDYGALLVGNTRTQTFTVANFGTATISGTVSVDTPFSVVSGASYTLGPGLSATTKIRYAPVSAVNSVATATFTGDHGMTVTLTGTATANPSPTTGAITGRVTRASDHAGLNGVEIWLAGDTRPRAATTTIGGQAGRYSISGLTPNANYTVIASPGSGLQQQYQPETVANVAVTAEQTTPVNIELPLGDNPLKPTPENTPVVLVRGFGKDKNWADEDAPSWAQMGSALVQAGFTTVWDPNQPEPGIVSGNGHVINGQWGIAQNVSPLLLYIKQKAVQYAAKHNGQYPPQIHIIAHSMGGLFTRGALQRNNQFKFTNPSFNLKVGKVVMLATPNCGSPLADYGRRVLLRSTLICDLLAPFMDPRWDSVSNLTTYVMKDYNNSNPWPSVPLYLISASNPLYGYNKPWNDGPDPCSLGILIRDENACNGTSGTDEDIIDGAVTKPSVNGVYWTRVHWTYDTSLPTYPSLYPVTSVTLNPVQSITDSDLGESLDHFYLLKNPAVITWVVKTLLNSSPTATPIPHNITAFAPAQDALSMDAATAQPSIQLQPFESVDGAVTNRATVVLPVTSDANTTLTFQLMGTDTNLVFRLNDPSGTPIDANTPQSNPNVQYTASALASNFLVATFTIANPTTGVWTAVVDASSISAAQAGYGLTVSGDSNNGLIALTADHFAQGQDVIISSLLADISTNPLVAVPNASITATIWLPDGTTNSLTLFDNGWHNDGAPNDGVYAAVLSNVQQAGTYSIAYRATGTNAVGHAFQRVATGSFSVSTGNGNIVGDPTFENMDTDGDGYADFLLVKAWVNPAVAGNYILAGDLVDVTGSKRFSQSSAFAADGTGPTLATLFFDLAEIRAAGGFGGFHIENLQLFEQADRGTAWLDAYRGTSGVTIPSMPATALFSAPATNDVPPLTVTFADTSTGTVTNRFWSFGDGTTTNTTATVMSYTYDSTGPKTVRLIVSGPLGANTNTQGNLVTVLVPAHLAVSPGTNNFGSVVMGQSSNLAFRVRNTGSVSLSGSASLLTSGAPFAIVSGTPFTVAGGGSTNVVVNFSPLSAGPASNRVVFASTGGGSTNPVLGIGLALPHLVVSPPTNNFGSVIVGSSSNLAFQVSNTGSVTLNGNASLVAGAASFTILTGTPFAVAGGGSTNVVVRFNPVSAGPFSNRVVIASNGGTQTNTVTGTGLAPAKLAVSPPTNNFGSVVVGQSSNLAFLVSNTGSVSLSGSASLLTGGSPFTITKGTSFTVAGGRSTNVLVRFSPVSAAAFNNKVVFAAGSAGALTNTVLGTGLAPGHIAVSPSSVDFGYVLTGATAQTTLVITNTGDVAVTNGTAAVTVNPPFSIQSGSSFTVPGHGSFSVGVRFAPVAMATFNDHVVISTANGGNTNVAVTGIGAIKPAACFSASPTNGIVSLPVTFTDCSTGSVTNRAWKFGDGDSSGAANPSHTYTNAGLFSVSLTVFGPGGSNTLTRTSYIVVVNPPDVRDYIAAAKLRYFDQASDAVPAQSATGFAFYAEVTPRDSNSVTSAADHLPGGAVKTLTPSAAGKEFSFNEFFTTDGALNTAYSNGVYTLSIATAQQGTLTPSLSLTGNAFPNVTPQILNYHAAQTINAAADFTLSWTNFSGGTANDFISLEVEDAQEKLVFQTPDFALSNRLDGTVTSVRIPAGTLAGCSSYSGRLLFLKITARDANSIPGGIGITGYGMQTVFSLTTTGGLWCAAVDLGGGWKWLEWFGYFNTTHDPWIYHQQHGWLYPYGTDTSSIHFWDGNKQVWWWTGATTYPYVYRFSDSSWLWYQKDSVNYRWFYNLTAKIWEGW